MAVNARRRAGDEFGPQSEEEADAQWYEVETGQVDLVSAVGRTPRLSVFHPDPTPQNVPEGTE